MKSKFMLGLFMALSAAVYAQPTITTATSKPVAGDSFVGYYVDTNGVTPGAAGASITWNMSAVVRNDSDTTSFMTCAATPHCSLFPGANISVFTGGDYMYGVSDTNGIELLGVYSDGTDVHVTNHLTLLRFPMTMGTVHNDTSALSISISGFTMYMTNYITHTADAWGTIITPADTFANALRVHTVTVAKDSVDIMGMPSVSENRTETYNWFVAGLRTPVMTIEIDTAGSGTNYVSSAKYYKATRPAPTAVANAVKHQGNINVYPNPTSGNVTFSFDAGDNTSLVVTDMTGSVVYTTDAIRNGVNSITIPTDNLANGLYMVRIQGNNTNMASRFSVIK